MAKNHALQRWGVEDSVELYGIRTWGAGFFDVSENGEVVVCPHGAKGPQIPLLEIIAGLHERGYDMPVLLRVENILSSRIAHIHESFRKAIRTLGYKGDYRGVFPIKVNQQQQVVEQIAPDAQSGYMATGFTEDWEHPIEGPKYGGVKAHNSCIGRDARYYASVFANGFYWVNEYTKSTKKVVVTFHSTGTSPFKNVGADGCKVGFLWRRFLKTDQDYQNNQWGEFFWFYYRLAEVYLNYAEACNEKPARDAAESLKYINMIRARAGLNKLEEAYPEINFMSDQAALREMIRKERMVELAFEGHRYYDCRRWMIAEQEMNFLPRTLNVAATSYESSWERTDQVWNRAMVFEPKHYFLPINQTQLDEMRNITQNYGW